jgi:hypothetical protein
MGEPYLGPAKFKVPVTRVHPHHLHHHPRFGYLYPGDLEANGLTGTVSSSSSVASKIALPCSSKFKVYEWVGKPQWGIYTKHEFCVVQKTFCSAAKFEAFKFLSYVWPNFV